MVALTTWRAARRQWPPVIAAPRGFTLLIPVPRRQHRRPPPISLPSHCSVVLLPALLCTGRHFARHCQTSMSRLQVVRLGQKKCPSPRPSCTENLPAVLASEAGQQEFPCHHLPLQAPPLAVASSGGSPTPPTYNKFHAAKELLPNHFSGHLGHSLGPSPAPPTRRHAHRH
jgi:hypothetical protein